MQTGLVLSLPVLAPALRSWRRRDPAARNGMPPHVTLLHPFMDSRAFDDDARARVAAALSGSAVPAQPGLDRKPVLLHVLHGWGGGAERWVRDFAAKLDDQGRDYILSYLEG